MTDGFVEFKTSGSTGGAKTIVKSTASLDADSSMLFRSFGDLFGEKPFVLATIRRGHMFGALWVERLPSLAGCAVHPETVLSVEELVAAADGKGKILVVTTPSFLEKAVKNEEFASLKDSLVGIVTSGSLLKSELSRKVLETTGISPTEIFGSTETGSVAWRRQSGGEEWTLFDEVSAEPTAEGLVCVDSGFSVARPFVMSDYVKFVSSRRFLLLGRADRNVKILEKFVSLPAVESALEAHAFVAKAHAIPSMEPVPRIWALIELTAEGKDELKRNGYAAMTALLKRETESVESFAFPRRIRYVEAFPYNEQGKLVNAAVYPVLRSRYQEPVAENASFSGDRFTVELTFIADAFYFDGHFKEFKILPGVVQLDYIERCIRRRWHLGMFAGELVRLKFQRPVLPGEKVTLEIVRAGEDRHSFSLKLGGDLCTSGVFVRKGAR